MERFRREGVALARLRHPGIVEIFDVGVEDGTHYFVMEIVEGRNLLSALEAREITLRNAVQAVRRAAEAVQFAHENGVPHRDLKPGNLLVTPDGGVKVLDFGLAKLRESSDRPLAVSGVMFGTPAYMSPE